MNKHLRNIAFISMLLMSVACTKEFIEVPKGNLDDIRRDLEATDVVSFRSTGAKGNVVSHIFTVGEDITVSDDFYAFANREQKRNKTFQLTTDFDLVKAYSDSTGVDYTMLPDKFYDFPQGKQLILPKGQRRSSPRTIEFYSKSRFGEELQPGNYLLPVVTLTGPKSEAVYVRIIVRSKAQEQYQLYKGDKMFLVYYLNTGEFDPRLVTEYNFRFRYPEKYDCSTGNIINLRKSTVQRDERSGRIRFVPSMDIKYVLEHREKYILPLQEAGRKICICIEGGGQGIGFCNLTDSQIEDLASQVVEVVDRYCLDGVNLWDRGSNYGKQGMPAVDKVSYPKFIKVLREKLGNGKLLTLVDYEAPTADFYDVSLCGGIEVGRLIDYAWSGYMSGKEPVQVIDPWNQGRPGVSVLHPRQPIAGMDPIRYGCVSMTGYKDNLDGTLMDGPVSWIAAGLRKNCIFVFNDIYTWTQNGTEGSMYYFPTQFLLDMWRAGSAGRVMVQIHGFEGGKYNHWRKDW